MSTRQTLTTALATLSTFIALLVLNASVASAAVIHVYEKSIGAEGEGPGQLSSPHAIAVNQRTHNIYVADAGNKRIEEFSPNGTYIAEINGIQTPEKEFGYPRQIAIDNSTNSQDPSAGDLYVVNIVYVDEKELDVIDKFTSTGVYVGEITGTPERPFGGVEEGTKVQVEGVTVDPTGHLWVEAWRKEVDEFGDAPVNEYITGWRTTSNLDVDGIAVDSLDDVYAISGGSIEKFSSHGELLEEGVANTIAGSGNVVAESGIALEEPGGKLIIDLGDVASALNAEGVPSFVQPTFGSENLSGETAGIAVDWSNGTVYVADTSTDTVDVFSTRIVADVSGAPATSLAPTSVTVNGTVDPDGVNVSECQFEYGPTSEYGYTQPCTPAPDAVNQPVPVSTNLTGLSRDSVYHYRVAVTNENGTDYSPDRFLVTPPTVEGAAQASGETSFAATLTGVIGSGEVTPSYRYVYGTTTAYGSSTPDATTGVGGQQVVTQILTGLQPDTTYHYALVASNFGGGMSTGPDQTFTTRPLVPPAVYTGGAEGIGLTKATVTGAVNPEGLDTSYHFEYGTTTGYGSTWPNIDAHAGSNSTPQGASVAIENLQPSTTYHYRLVATNEDGTTYGPDQAFTTTAYPVSIVQATPLGGTLGIPEAKPQKVKAKKKTKLKKRKHGKGKKATHKKRRGK
ncbi:MAG TPA: hypothetical protein VIJ50_14780 [Solirubrobacteraceae bacterium]